MTTNRFRERADREDHASSRNAPAAGDAGSGNLTGMRAEAQSLLAAGDAAINRALSRDSEEFLRANRQQGGQ